MALEEEMLALDQHTWDLVRLPSQKSVVRCRLVCIIEANSKWISGSLEKLVAKSYNQMYCIVFIETLCLLLR